ncbi:hypothetical protein [Oceanicoccus sp. KOV_DT_Chl]
MKNYICMAPVLHIFQFSEITVKLLGFNNLYT